MTARIEHSPAAAGAAAAAGEARPVARTTEARIERLRAPFSLRCGALLIDYTLPVAVVALFTLFARSFDANTTWFGVGLLTLGYVLGAARPRRRHRRRAPSQRRAHAPPSLNKRQASSQ